MTKVTLQQLWGEAWDMMKGQASKDEQVWIRKLMDQGVKAAHPDDGWVDHEDNTVIFSYPQFNCQPEVGDLIALGRPEKWRLVKVIEVYESLLGLIYYRFKA